MPTTENGSMWPQCCMVDIPLTITWQCHMVVSPVVRHSGSSAFRHGAGQTDRPSDFYIQIAVTVAQTLLHDQRKNANTKRHRDESRQRLAAGYYKLVLICQRAGVQMTYGGRHCHLIRVDATRSTPAAVRQ